MRPFSEEETLAHVAAALDRRFSLKKVFVGGGRVSEELNFQNQFVTR